MTEQVLRSAINGAVSHIGRQVTFEAALSLLSPAQRQKFRAPPFLTSQRLQYRVLAKGSLLVEISTGEGITREGMAGLTVFCIGELASDGPEWDHALSSAYDTAEEVAGRLAVLNEGGRERVAALAAA